MAMVLPKLYGQSNRFAIFLNKIHLEKYKHLIKCRNNPSIMEFGYADGGTSQKAFFPYLPSDLKQFVAADISETMVDYAKKNSTHPIMEFVTLDIATQQVPSQYLERFDHIFGFLVMHMVKDPRQAYTNMKNMLKPGGSILLTFFKRTPCDHAFDRLTTHPEWGQYEQQRMISPYYHSLHPRQDLENDLIKGGFNHFELFEHNGSYEFLDENEFDGLYIAVNAVLPYIPEQNAEEYKKIYLETMRTGKHISIKYRNGKTFVETKFEMFIVSAQKL
ncbi:hypothetical protein JTB14_036985 [Gonioctena quinquepunctata]|nr:hypothetical protein JTB14_036985 [Gonioctena quinquepunctata]